MGKFNQVISLFIILPILLLPGCATSNPVLSINPGLSEYSPAMSSVPGLELISVLTLDLKNSDVKYHWIAEQGTFLTWHDEGKGQVQELGDDIRTNLHKVYWSIGTGVDISVKSFQILLTVEKIDTGEVIAKTSLEIKQKKPGIFTVD